MLEVSLHNGRRDSVNSVSPCGDVPYMVVEDKAKQTCSSEENVASTEPWFSSLHIVQARVPEYTHVFNLTLSSLAFLYAKVNQSLEKATNANTELIQLSYKQDMCEHESDREELK